MANPLRGESSFTVAGKTYRLKYSWNAAAAFEDAAGRPLSDALQDVVRKRISAKSLRAMLWAGLLVHHAEISPEAAGELIDQLGRKEAQRLMGCALQYFFPELEPDEKPPDPPPPGPASA